MVKCPSCGHEFAATKKKSPTTYAEDFLRFWEEYDARRIARAASKPDALKAWDQVSRDLPPIADLLDCVRAYKSHISKASIPACHPATWLRQKRWEGFLPENPKAPALELEAVAQKIAAAIGIGAFNAWLQGAIITESFDEVIIGTTSAYRKDYILKNLGHQIVKAAGKRYITVVILPATGIPEAF